MAPHDHRERKALELNPSLVLPHDYLARAYDHLGLLDLADRESHFGDMADPSGDPVERLRARGAAAIHSGHFADAVQLLEQVRSLSGPSLSDYYLAQAYFYSGDTARSLTMLDSLTRSSSASSSSRARATLASFLAGRGSAGDRSRASALLDTVTAGSYMDHHVAYSIGTTRALLGDKASALTWLARARDSGFPCYPWFARDSLLAPLRDDAEFKRLLSSVREMTDAARARYQTER